MRHSASRKRTGSRSPGRPIQPGQVLNPQGNNQYTYRRDFETAIDRFLAGVATRPDVEAAQIPEHIRKDITAETTRAEVIARVLVSGAMAGDSKLLLEVVKRLRPVTSKHELSVPDEPAPSQPEPDRFSEAIKHLSTEELEQLAEIQDKLLKIEEELRISSVGEAD